MDPFKKISNSAAAFFNAAFDEIPAGGKINLKRFIPLLVASILGAVHWWKLFNGGDIPFTRPDFNHNYNFFRIAQAYFETGELPWLIDKAHHGVNWFLAIPEVVASPQIFLLAWLPVKKFFIANLLIQYVVACLGLWVLWRKLNLSVFAFLIVFALFQFNGHIVAHQSAGHVSWGGYFFLPFVLAWVLG